MLPTRMHRATGGFPRSEPVQNWKTWKRQTVCGKYLRLELTTQDWAKVNCKMCLKVKGSKKDNQ